MQNRWYDNEAREYIEKYAEQYGEDLALRTYTARLLGADPYLVLHGGGNTSVKGTHKNILGEEVPAIYVKASGWDMASIEPEGHPALELGYLKKLRQLDSISDEDMLNELRTHLFDHKAATPSIEALVHAFLPAKFIDHTHADAILTLTNQKNGEKVVRDALGDDVIILPYTKPGFELAKAVADAYEKKPDAEGIVLMHHGLITWGESASESYDGHIELVCRAEDFVSKRIGNKSADDTASDEPLLSEQRIGTYKKAMPILRGLLASETGDADKPYRKVILTQAIAMGFAVNKGSHNKREECVTPPVTTDHLIRTKSLPMWVEIPVDADPNHLREILSGAIGEYENEYIGYMERNSSRLKPGIEPFDPKPRVILSPGFWPITSGRDYQSAVIAGDIAVHTLVIKRNIHEMGAEYAGLAEEDIFDMEYFPMQHAKLAGRKDLPLDGHIALVTGAGGAIGAGICRGLLEQGCHVAGTDIDRELVGSLAEEMNDEFSERFLGLVMDVTDPESIRPALDEIIAYWGGIDILVHCAGVAHVSTIADMDVDAFKRLEAINTEGTLLVLKHVAPIFEAQGTGGDVVLVSTKNVFAPGAGFGAYSATKAASHQLGRIASLEFARMDVRVNMISPDAVFSDASGRKSGLWQEVGPDRMKARGLDEKGLEEYYQGRNLLKAKVTAEHCANAVLFFVTRQTPTTGATIPVDGGLPDATPR
jgi:rhamnose utilization protein RhaD (predicted bifunctional aldolase and dehydrogenase)/NAD(P)-dependent dehydrogenase (short-subunit alcohol dehydrogenase family)